jgi:hypothetical protein
MLQVLRSNQPRDRPLSACSRCALEETLREHHREQARPRAVTHSWSIPSVCGVFVHGLHHRSESNQNAHDYEELEIIDSHLDGSGGGSGRRQLPAQEPALLGGSIGNPPPLAQASRANGPLYVDQLPGGLSRITHILWALNGK